MNTPSGTVHRTFPVTGPLHLDVKVGIGSVTVHARDDLTEAVVTVTPRRPQYEYDLAERIRIDMHGSTLVVHAAKLGGVFELIGGGMSRAAVDVDVVVPSGTSTKIVSYGADVVGRRSDRQYGHRRWIESYRARLRRRRSPVAIRQRSGPGGQVSGTAEIKSGSGTVRLGDLGHRLVMACGSGNLEVDVAHGPVSLRAGSGQADIAIAEGDVDLVTGSGGLTVGLRPGQVARLDVTTGSGQLLSDLPVDGQRARIQPADHDSRAYRQRRRADHPRRELTARTARPSAAARSPRSPTTTSSSSSHSAVRRSSRGERTGDRIRLDTSLGERALHQKYARLTVGLQIDSGDQRLVEQKRQHVVAMHPRGRRRIDLDAVPEAEQSQGSLPIPDERVERAQQRLRLHRPWAPRCRPQVAGCAPAVDGDRDEITRLHQLSDPQLRLRPGQPEVIPEIGLRRHPEGPRCHQHELTLGLLDGRRRGCQYRRGDHPLGEVVQPLEVHPPGRRDPTGPEQILQRHFAVVPVPHLPPARGLGRSTPVCAARMGPRSATSSYIRSTRSGKSRAMRTMRPQASVPARAIRHRRCGCRRTGISEASCPQYSNNSRRIGPAVCAVSRSRTSRG